jgi:hypothetical protein
LRLSPAEGQHQQETTAENELPHQVPREGGGSLPQGGGTWQASSAENGRERRLDLKTWFRLNFALERIDRRCFASKVGINRGTSSQSALFLVFVLRDAGFIFTMAEDRGLSTGKWMVPFLIFGSA